MGFLGDDFLLSTATGRRLFHEVAESLPIIDAHNHLSAKAVAANRALESITDLWLAEDHYKWRLMRAHGVEEQLVTGETDPRERFRAFAAAVGAAPMNPLYAWSHMELRQVFGIGTVLGRDTADAIYDAANERLATGDITPRSLLRGFGVEVACTTDDPADSLAHHGVHDGVRILPTFRPDAASAIANPRAFGSYVTRLSEAAECPIRSPSELLQALRQRHDAFHEAGCRASDHALPDFTSHPIDSNTIERTWQQVRSGRVPTPHDEEVFREWILREVARMNAARGWVMQLHVGPLRNTRSTLAEAQGPDSGGDGVGNPVDMRALARFLDQLDASSTLPKTIIYTMRAEDAVAAASIGGSFNGLRETTARGHVQIGAAWWFDDTETGIRRRLRLLAETGSLGASVGMVTDSRSFLSMVRHEYFRRILCDEIGRDVERGLLPNEDALLAGWIRDIACENARSFFGFGGEELVA